MANSRMSACLVLPATLVLSACAPGEAEVLQTNYDKTTSRYGTVEQKCSELTKIADAWARDGNQARFDEVKLKADVECLSAEVRRM